MKVRILSIMLIFATVTFFSNCGGNSIEMTAEMSEFIGLLKGTAADVSLALEKFGATDEIKTSDMTMYDLKDPKITAQKDNCYSIEFSVLETVRMYDLCWKDGKIIEITDKGMK